MRKYLLITLYVLSGMLAYAQTSFYHPFSIGAGYGVTVAYAGEETLTSSNAFNFNINYHITPFTAVSMEGQVGQLSGGDAMNDTFSKQYLNSYNALLLHADVQLGELMDFSNSQFLNGLKNVYFGTGIGILYNKITDINLIGINNSITYSTYYVKSSNLLIPLRMGYEFKIFNRRDEPQVRFDINYSFNTAFGEGLDGYYNPAGASVKFYSYFSLGLKYGFGNPHAYRKAVYYSAF